MVNVLNILTRLIYYSFNLFLETKYRIKVYLNKNSNKNQIVIKDIYFIDKISGKILNLNTKQYLNKINELLKYSKHIILNNVVENELKNNVENFIMDIEYSKNGKDYKINFILNEGVILQFPVYGFNELKRKNMNKIVSINCSEFNEERLKLLEKYGGPLNDFYESRDLGISLNMLYSVKYEKFLFRGVNLEMEDTFLNTYVVNEENVGSVLKIKGGLEDNELKEDCENEKYILSKYRKLDLSGRDFMNGFMRYIKGIIFGKEKEI